MLGEAVVRLNYAVSYQLCLLGNEIRNRRSSAASYFRKGYSLSKLSHSANVLKNSDELNAILRKSDTLYEDGCYDESLHTLEQYNDHNHSQILWRQGRLLYRHKELSSNKSVRCQLISSATEKLTNALNNDEQNCLIHIWMSIFLLGHVIEHSISPSLFSYINRAYTHMLKASELDPNEPLAWYSLGYFEYSVAELPWYQRKLVFAALTVRPRACFQKALEYFEKAEQLKPGFNPLNRLMMAKCLIHLKQLDKARVILKDLAECKNIRNMDYKTSKESAESLLKTLKN